VTERVLPIGAALRPAYPRDVILDDAAPSPRLAWIPISVSDGPVHSLPAAAHQAKLIGVALPRKQPDARVFAPARSRL